MPLEIKDLPVPIRIDEHGTARVGGTRVTLDSVVAEIECGATPEQVVQDYDTLDLADVYLVFAYYFRHKAEVEAYIETQQRLGEEIRKRIEATEPSKSFRERLLARRAQLEQGDASVPRG